MPPRIEIIGDAEKAAPFIIWAKREWGLREGRWCKHTGTCLIELFRAGDTGLIRIIPETVAGFAIHPRSSKYINGIDTETGSPISNVYPMFPLYDNDNGTMLLSIDETDKTPDVQNYGIAYWTDGDSTLSWRCLPELAFGVARGINIEGITVLDVEVDSTKYYTPLSPYIYEQGEKIPTPGKVRAAAYLSGTLVCLCTVNYTQYDYTTTSGFPKNPVGTDGGYFDELYALTNSNTSLNNATNTAGESVSGWERIGYRTSQISNTPCWFSEDGSVLHENDVYWQLAKSANGVLTTKIVLRVLPSNIFTLYTSPYWRQSANTTYQDFYAPSSSATVKQFLEDKTIVSQNYSELAKSIQRVFERRPDPTNYYIELVNTWYDYTLNETMFQLRAVGFKGTLPVDWIDGLKLVSIPATCKSTCNEVSRTEIVTDSCGFTNSITVTADDCISGGRWVAEPWEYYYPCGCGDVRNYGWNYTLETDTTRITYYVFYCSFPWCPGTQATCPLDPNDYFGWGGCGFLEKKLVENWVC